MTTLLQDLLIAILFACVMLAFTTIGQAATEMPAADVLRTISA
jgi:hypothetical protein